MNNTSPTLCPACGFKLAPMTTSCEACGSEFKSQQATSTVQAMAAHFQRIEEDVVASGLIGKKLANELVLRKGRFIRDFPVPNSKEDLLALIHYIRPRIENAIQPDPNMQDGRAKFSEVMSLAKSAYKSDAKARAEFEAIESSARVTLAGGLKMSAKRSPVLFVALALILVAGGAAFAYKAMEGRQLAQCMREFEVQSASEAHRLEDLVQAIVRRARASQWDAALEQTDQLRWGVASECQSDAAKSLAMQWDGKRKQLEQEIQNQRVTQEQKSEEVRKSLEAEQKAALQKMEADKKEQARRIEAAKALEESRTATKQRRSNAEKEF